MLELTDVHVAYGAVQALRGVNLCVGRGEIVTLIGANGAGKTTLLMALSGLVPAASGSLMFEGRSLQGLAPEERVRMGIVQVPEGRRIFGRLSVRENLRLGAFLRTKTREVLADMDEVLGLFPALKPRLEQPAGTLSGGEQQMLALARGLMGRPRLLLLDEPSLGLAPKMVQTMFALIQDIYRRGMSILLVEQNAYQALRAAQRGYVLETGQIVRCDSADALLHDPAVRAAYLGV